MNTNALKLISILLFLLFAGLGTVIFILGLASNNYQYLYIYCAILATLIPATFIFNKKRIDPFEPIVLVTLAIFFGTTLRAFYIVSAKNARADFLMMWTTFDDIMINIPIMLGGIISLCIGYYSSKSRINIARFRLFQDQTIIKKTPKPIIILCILTGFLGIALYIQAHGIDFSDGIFATSTKKSLLLSSSSGETVYAAGYQIFLAKFSQYGFIICFAYLMAGYLKKSTINWFILLISFSSIAFIALISSSRSTILVLVLTAIIILSYYKHLKTSTLIITLVAGALTIWGMGILRAENSINYNIEQEAIADSIIGSGNSIDFIRTSSIIDIAKERNLRLYGSSYTAAFTGFIPRSIWPDKPNISLGAWVKQDIFGVPAQRNGWPPGMIAEAYLNFGPLGILVVMFLFGVMLRIYYQTFKPLLGKSIVATIIYGASTWRLSFGTIGLNFAQGVYQALQFLIPLLIFLFIQSRLRRSKSLKPKVDYSRT